MKQTKTTMMMTILLLASVAVVVGGLAVIPALELQQAEAGCEKGLPNSAPAVEASKGRCLDSTIPWLP
jgi:hypothetical protein